MIPQNVTTRIATAAGEKKPLPFQKVHHETKGAGTVFPDKN